jgi:hypothetical protein
MSCACFVIGKSIRCQALSNSPQLQGGQEVTFYKTGETYFVKGECRN